VRRLPCGAANDSITISCFIIFANNSQNEFTTENANTGSALQFTEVYQVVKIRHVVRPLRVINCVTLHRSVVQLYSLCEKQQNFQPQTTTSKTTSTTFLLTTFRSTTTAPGAYHCHSFQLPKSRLSSTGARAQRADTYSVEICWKRAIISRHSTRMTQCRRLATSPAAAASGDWRQWVVNRVRVASLASEASGGISRSQLRRRLWACTVSPLSPPRSCCCWYKGCERQVC